VNTSPSSNWPWFVQSVMPEIMNVGCRSAKVSQREGVATPAQRISATS
jgi:hypothetical protein